MKKINVDDYTNLKFVERALHPKFYRVSNPSHGIVAATRELGVGEGLTFENNEWHYKTTPGSHLANVARRAGLKISIRTLADKTGYAVLRKA